MRVKELPPSASAPSSGLSTPAIPPLSPAPSQCPEPSSLYKKFPAAGAT